MELEQLWQSALAEVELQISRPNFATWLKNSQLISNNDGVALVALPNVFAKEWVEKKYSKIILGAIRNIDASTKKVEFVVLRNTAQTTYDKKTVPQHKVEKNIIDGQLTFQEFKVDAVTNLNPRYTFKTFIVGSSNELAYAAAMAVVKNVGKKYNPLFIYGGTGVGKTHLIQAIGNEVKKLYQDSIKVKYVTSERFANEVVSALQSRRWNDLKERYRSVDMLIIDDIHFIGGKEKTEEEFFHTFNALYENSKQIIISSDRPPEAIPTLEERLRSRFQGGMIVDISYPDYEMRVAIIKTKLLESGKTLSDELIDIIASRVRKNIRELEGILNKIFFYQETKNLDITKDLIEEIIDKTLQRPAVNITADQVIKAVAEFYEVSPNDIVGRCRKREIVEPRQISMYLLREILEMSYPFIGEKVGKRDHTTAMHACEKIAQEINKNPSLNQKIMLIKDAIYKDTNYKQLKNSF
jgi:chromosomal replication initiator protein